MEGTLSPLKREVSLVKSKKVEADEYWPMTAFMSLFGSLAFNHTIRQHALKFSNSLLRDLNPGLPQLVQG